MNRYTPLSSACDVELGRFDHPCGAPHSDPAEEMADAYSVNLVERGGFAVATGRRRWRLQRGDLFVTHPGFAYRIHHDDLAPQDSCLSITYRSLEEMESWAEENRRHRARPVLPATNRMEYLRWAAARLLADAHDDLAIETWTMEVLAEVAQHPGTARALFRQNQAAWYAERVHATREQLEQRYADEHSLASLARSVGMSRFHFLRVFSELAGTPPHRYLLNVRLNRAARMLRDGDSVTNACYNCGFRNLSHFIRRFQKAYGVTPSRYTRKPS